jgi:hypothetical protein
MKPFKPSTTTTTTNSTDFDFKSKIEPLAMYHGSSNENQKTNNDHSMNENINFQLERENQELKLKYRLLEEKCKSLESRLNSQQQKENYQNKSSDQAISNNSYGYSSVLGNQRLADATNTTKSTKQPSEQQQQPKLELYPPLRVRLQKLNEKSVALKWNHNAKNLLVELTGYNVYINNDLLATMKASDKIASIDGIKEEGEYRIFIKSVCGQHESEASNTVITRVKKKPTVAASHDDEKNKPKRDTKRSTSSDQSSSASSSESSSSDTSDENESSVEERINENKSIDKIIKRLSKFDEKRATKNEENGPGSGNNANRLDVASRLFKQQSTAATSSSKVNNLVKLFESSDDSVNSGKQAKPSNGGGFPFEKTQIESSSSFSVLLSNRKNETGAEQKLANKPPANVNRVSDEKATEAPPPPQILAGEKPTNGRSNSVKQITSNHNMASTHHLLAEFIQNAKYSNSEPNLTKTQSTTSGSTGRASLVRQSISLSDSNEDNEEIKN